MGRTSFKFGCAAAVVIAAVCGCQKESAVASVAPGAATNAPTIVRKIVLTADQRQLAEARSALDSEDYARALKLARGLLDTKEPEVLSDLVGIFGWIGRRALPELEELMANDDAGIRTAALQAWELAIEDISSESVRTMVLTNAVSKLNDPAVIDGALMHILNIRTDYALPALEGLATNRSLGAVSTCARAAFEHIAGEPYSSPERTRRLIKDEE